MGSTREAIRKRFLPTYVYGSAGSFKKLSMACYKLYMAVLKDLKKSPIPEDIIDDITSLFGCIDCARECFGSYEDISDFLEIEKTLLLRLLKAGKKDPKLHWYIRMIFQTYKQRCS